MNEDIAKLILQLKADNKLVSPLIAKLIIELDKKLEKDKLEDFRNKLINEYESQ